MAELIVAIIGLTIAAGFQTYQAITAGVGGSIQKKLLPIVRALQKYVNNKNVQLSDLMQAYNDKSGKLATTLLHSAGLGARAAALSKEITQTESNYRAELHKLNQQIAEANTDLRSADEAQSIAGTTAQANDSALKVADKLAGKYPDNNINQNIQGGLTNE